MPENRLALHYNLSRAFNSTVDLDKVLNRGMDDVIVAMHAERNSGRARGAG
jgi:hypothetical protein